MKRIKNKLENRKYRERYRAFMIRCCSLTITTYIRDTNGDKMAVEMFSIILRESHRMIEETDRNLALCFKFTTFRSKHTLLGSLRF